MARTMTVDLGDELRDFIESLIASGDYRTQSEVIRDSLRLLREKQAESKLQTLRDLLAEGISSGEPQTWDKDIFLQRMKAKVPRVDEKIKLTPKAEDDLTAIWNYSYSNFGEAKADEYVSRLGIFLR